MVLTPDTTIGPNTMVIESEHAVITSTLERPHHVSSWCRNSTTGMYEREKRWNKMRTVILHSVDHASRIRYILDYMDIKIMDIKFHIHYPVQRSVDMLNELSVSVKNDGLN